MAKHRQPSQAPALRLELLQDSRLLGLTPQPSRLLRFLALNSGRPVPQDVAIDLLSGSGRASEGDGNAITAAAIHTYVGAIRRAVGPERIVTQRDPTTYTFKSSAQDWIDIFAFEELLEDGLRAMEAGKASDALKSLDSALALWMTNPAADLDYTELLSSSLVRDVSYYDRKLHAAHRSRLQALIALGDKVGIEHEIERLIDWVNENDRARYDESLWHLRSMGYIALGNVSAAIDAYDEFQALGGRPSSKYRQLIASADAGEEPTETLAHAAPSPVTLDDALTAGLETIKEEIFGRGVAGSQRIRLGDLIERQGLWVQPRGLNLSSVSAIDDVLEYILSSVSAPESNEPKAEGPHPTGKWIVVGSPGIGKSTIAYRILSALTERRRAGDLRSIPFLINLRVHRNEPLSDLLNPHWAHDTVAAALLSNEASVKWQNELRARRIVTILDSLDEFLIGRPQSDIQELLASALLREATVLLCRTQFFDQCVQASDLAAEYRVLELGPWSSGEREAYVKEYYSVFFGETGIAPGRELLTRLRRSTEMARICSVPVRLNMALDLLSPASDKLPGEVDLISLYNTYLTNVLAIDATRPGSILSGDQKFDLLEELAWRYFDEGSMGEADPPLFTSDELRQVLSELLPHQSADYRQAVLEDLRNRTILEASREQRLHLGTDVLHFNQKSFQEYLVATKVYHALLQSANETSSVMSSHLSPEVSEFLKEYLKRLNSLPRMRQRAAANGMEALKLLLTVRQEQGVAMGPRMRIAIQQLYYYLGNLRVAEVQDFLEAQLDNETDRWLHRGLAIGLGFSGRHRPVSRYIDGLRHERLQFGADSPQNSVNIGVKLSYFGDQSFEPANPDLDRGAPTCGRTVTTLVYQLGTETERGCWRIDLYSLVDLWRWREFARPSFRSALLERADEVRDVVRFLRDDGFSQAWPEVEEFAAVVRECGIDL